MTEASLGDVPRRETLSVRPTTPVHEVISAMNERHLGCALVVEQEKLVGIFTERDVLTKVVGRGLDLSTTAVRAVMTANPDALPEHATLAFALNRMSVEGYRHVPIVDEHHRPVGVVSMRDVIVWMVELFPGSVHNLPHRPSIPQTPDGA